MIIIFVAISLPQIFKSNEITWNETERQPQIIIKDLSESDPDFGSDNVSILQNELFNVISQADFSIDSVKEYSIVPDSFKTLYFDYYQTKFVSFLIDIPELSNQYQIFYSYSFPSGEAPDMFISILCSPESKDCTDAKGQTSRNKIVSDYLGYFDFEYFTAYMDEDSTPTITISPIDLNATETTKKLYINKIKEAIQSLGISPDLFKYKVLTQADMTYRLD